MGVGPRVGILPDSGDGYFVRINGVPDVTYHLQRAPDVAGPWETVNVSTAPTSGLIPSLNLQYSTQGSEPRYLGCYPSQFFQHKLDFSAASQAYYSSRCSRNE